MENGLVGFQNGEYERRHARDEKLRNDDEDVLYPLIEARTHACRKKKTRCEGGGGGGGLGRSQ